MWADMILEPEKHTWAACQLWMNLKVCQTGQDQIKTSSQSGKGRNTPLTWFQMHTAFVDMTKAPINYAVVLESG